MNPLAHASGQLLLLCIALQVGQAQAAMTCTKNVSSMQASLPTGTLGVARDSTSPARISDWVDSETNPVFTCTTTAGETQGPSPRSTLNNVASYSEGGITYPVYATGVAGIGLIMGWYGYVDNGSSRVLQVVGPSFINGQRTNGSSTRPLGIYLRSALVRYAAAAAGTVALGQIGDIGAIMNTSTVIATVPLQARNNPTVVLLSCQTGNVIVTLGAQKAKDFTGVGSRVGEQAFDIPVRNCPSGLTGLSYQIDASEGVVDAQQGLLQLDSSPGTATGIAVSLRQTDNNTPLPIGQRIRVPYQGSGQITLHAAYQQTANQITSGSANTTVQFTLFYE